MKLYLQIRDGVPVSDPAYEDNLILVFGEVPSDWVPFVRRPIEEFNLSPHAFQKVVHSYQLCGTNTWADVWTVVDMSEQEKEHEMQRHLRKKPRNTNIKYKFNQHTSNWEPDV